MSEPRVVTAVTRFKGSPGREREAAEAWAFELTYYFLRAVGEQPAVTYDAATMIYTCTGLMTTTHPHDRSPVTEFDAIAEPWDLDFCADPDRRKRLRDLYPEHGVWWDGREH